MTLLRVTTIGEELVLTYTELMMDNLSKLLRRTEAKRAFLLHQQSKTRQQLLHVLHFTGGRRHLEGHTRPEPQVTGEVDRAAAASGQVALRLVQVNAAKGTDRATTKGEASLHVCLRSVRRRRLCVMLFLGCVRGGRKAVSSVPRSEFVKMGPANVGPTTSVKRISSSFSSLRPHKKICLRSLPQRVVRALQRLHGPRTPPCPRLG
jgi:hypothetical protein